MGISVAKFEDAAWTDFSTGGAQTEPITTVHDGRIEQPRDLLLYVRNDDSGLEYTTIKVDFVDYSAPNDIEGIDTGWFVKVRAGVLQPTEDEWAAITAGVEVDMPDISGIGSEAFWLRINSPRGLSVSFKTDVAVRLKYIEGIV